DTLALGWLISVMVRIRPSSCITRCVDVPGSTHDCNMRGLPAQKPVESACGTQNALAVQSLHETSGTPAWHHRSHLWHDRDAITRTVVLPDPWGPGHG